MKIDNNLPGPMVSRLRRKWKTRLFIETGTAGGDTTELAAVIFDRVWSCDIDADLANAARARLAEYSNVEISIESSSDFLRRIKPQVDCPVMYWLDAHWCGGPVVPDRECPVLDELRAIGSMNGDSVILIDDAELMIKPPPPPHNPAHWPTVEQVKEELDSWGEEYAFEWYQRKGNRVLAIAPIVRRDA